MIVAMNSFAKLASDVHHPVEIVFYRNLVALAALIILLGCRGDWAALKTARSKAHILRGLVGTLSIVLVFYAFKYLPVADATALMYSAPLMIAALSMPVLGERVGPYRWLAIIAGFGGVLVMVQPAGGGEAAGYFFALAAAGTIAAVSLCLRDLGRTEPAITTVFYFILIGTVVTAPLLPFLGTMPTADTLAILAVVGIAGTAQQFLKTHALALAPAATLSPLQFTGLVWGVLFGWLLFGDWPQAHLWIGAVIVIASNLLIYWRERQHEGKGGKRDG